MSQRTILISSIALSIVWIYMGLVPKILFPETGEMQMTKGLGLFAGNERAVVTFIGIGEILFGFIILFVRKKIVHYFNILALLGLAIGALLGKPEIYTFPFNPFGLSVAMIGLSVVCLVNMKRLAY